MNVPSRHQDQSRIIASWASFRSLPGWVQIWVGGLLVPVNAASFALLDTWSGRATAVAALLVVLSNVPIMLQARGMTKLMSLPHLFIWGPLQVLLIWHLRPIFGGEVVSATEHVYGLLVVAVNGISLVFDAMDSWRWLKGDRGVPGEPV